MCTHVDGLVVCLLLALVILMLQVIESAMAVVPYDVLEVKPGSSSILAPEAVRH